ncbi:MAG: hypothetical protein DLM61_07495 [Pseudonocardiales bacterium]|nr:MAG: hypothetical protein DLM61_07495 [Pseudonocardiales bacterium]
MAGEIVVVEPLTRAREGGLFTAGQDRDIWRYLTAFPNACESPARFHRWMEEAIAATDEGTQVSWAILERSSGTAIGSTRYLALRPEHRGLEIG